jgi:hypothetical protein
MTVTARQVTIAIITHHTARAKARIMATDDPTRLPAGIVIPSLKISLPRLASM